ncbi:membrane protein insertase YidC [Candidatus Peregrinibacteria bacterium]|nr:membrane protein insertase YidC [Candidatus Peregrinibacteria bacterium]
MNNKAFQNILKNALTFLVIFLAINFIFNSFFSNEESNIPKSGITFESNQNEYSLYDSPILKIENNTDQILTLDDRCPNTPLPVQKFENGVWQDLTITKEATCDENKSITIEPGETREISFEPWKNKLFDQTGNYKFLLPMEEKTLETGEISVNQPGFFAWIWQSILYQPIYNALIFFASILPGFNLGLAIILLTIVVRTLLLIPNQKALKSQKKLQQIQPKIAELKTKHGDNKEKIAMETMAIYKEQKVNPFGSCLPLLLQLPFLIAIFQVIRNGVGDEHLLYGPLQQFDSSQINTVFLGLELTEVNFLILPFIVGGFQFIQMKLAMSRNRQKQPKDKKPASEMEIANRTMIYIMPIMIAVFTASVPAGVGLYWASSTIYGIGQQLVINRQMEQETTQVRVVNEGKNKKKKEKYKELNEQRKANKED